MRINGKESLACLCRAGDVGRGERPVILEPLRNLLWVGDLVVDLAPLTGAIEEVGLPVIRIADRQDGVWPAEPALGQFENCIECGLCVSACPVAGSDDRFLGPAALAAGSRVLEGAHHGLTAAAMQRVAGEHGVWRCHGAFECSDVCPAEVDPAGKIFKVRGSLLRTAMREGWK
jgi:succinate dehydrogenase / fumarate reductase iron-sulfur subunit